MPEGSICVLPIPGHILRARIHEIVIPDKRAGPSVSQNPQPAGVASRESLDDSPAPAVPNPCSLLVLKSHCRPRSTWPRQATKPRRLDGWLIARNFLHKHVAFCRYSSTALQENI